MHAVEVGERHETARLAFDHEIGHCLRGSAVRSKRCAGRTIRHEVECPEDTQTAHLADYRVLLLQGAQARAENLLADHGGVLDDSLFLHRIDGRDDRSRGERVTGIGQAAREDALVKGRRDLGTDHYAADRHVAGVRALGEDDEVGLDIPVLVGEPLTGAGKARHGFVSDVDDSVLIAECAHALEVAGRRNQDARGADNRLEDDACDGVGAFELNDLLEVLQCALGFLDLTVGPEGGTVGIRPEEVHVLRGVLIRPAAGITCCGDRGTGVAVVRAVGREHLVLVCVNARHADGILDCICAAIGEEHLRHIRRGQLDDALRGIVAGIVRVLRSDGRQQCCLILDRLDDLGVLVADIDVDQLRGEVEELVAVVIPEVAALGCRNAHRLQSLLRTPGMEDVFAIHVVDGLAVGGICRVFHRDSSNRGRANLTRQC